MKGQRKENVRKWKEMKEPWKETEEMNYKWIKKVKGQLKEMKGKLERNVDFSTFYEPETCKLTFR